MMSMLCKPVSFYDYADAGVDCYRHSVSMRLSFLVYGSFTLLFGKLFYDVVGRKKSKTKTK